MEIKPAGKNKAQDACFETTSTMTSEQGSNLIMAPMLQKKRFNQIEKENKLAFIVTEKATKKQIVEAIRILYEADIRRSTLQGQFGAKKPLSSSRPRRSKRSCYKARPSLKDQLFSLDLKVA